HLCRSFAAVLDFPVFLSTIRPPPLSTLFPYTTLFRSDLPSLTAPGRTGTGGHAGDVDVAGLQGDGASAQLLDDGLVVEQPVIKEDRKSTRLNSSHVSISYAVFCLKKKKKVKTIATHTS